MEGGTRIALGLAGGYLLGRSRKGRLLLMAAAIVAGRGAVGGLAQRGASLGSTEVRHLADQGQQTMKGLFGKGIDALADRIHDTTEALRRPASEAEEPAEQPEQPEGADAEAPESPPEEAEEESEGPEDEYEEPTDEEERPEEERHEEDERRSGEAARPRLSGGRRGPVDRRGDARRSYAGSRSRR